MTERERERREREEFFDSQRALKKVKVSHSLIAVGAVGVRVPLYLGHSFTSSLLIIIKL